MLRHALTVLQASTALAPLPALAAAYYTLEAEALQHKAMEVGSHAPQDILAQLHQGARSLYAPLEHTALQARQLVPTVNQELIA